MVWMSNIKKKLCLTPSILKEIKMKCKACGAEISSDSIFCGECGRKHEPNEIIETKDSTKINKRNKTGMIKLLSALVVLVIVSLVIGFAFIGNNDDIHIENNYIVGVDSETRFYKSSGEFDEFDHDGIYAKYSLDYSTAAFYDGENSLFIYREDEFIEIEEDVLSYYLSPNGKKIAYTVELDGINAELYVYDVTSKEAVLISDEVLYFDDNSDDYTMYNVVFSADSKYISFVADYDPKDGDYYSYICKIGNEPVEYKKNTVILGMSKNKKLIYESKYDQDDYVYDFYVTKNDKSIKLISNEEALFIVFNKNQTQAIFYKNEKTYFSENGNEEVKLDNEEIYNTWDLVAYTYESMLGEIFVIVYGYDDLSKVVYKGDDALYYINSEYKADKIVKDVDYYTISKDYRSIIFIEDDSIVLIDDVTVGDEVKLDIRDGVEEYYTTEDLDTIYYLTDEQELYLYNKKKSVKVGDETDQVVINRKTGVLYYISDEELHQVKGSKVEKISLDDDVIEVDIYNNIVVVKVKDGDEIAYYHSVNDGPFEYQFNRESYD